MRLLPWSVDRHYANFYTSCTVSTWQGLTIAKWSHGPTDFFSFQGQDIPRTFRGVAHSAPVSENCDGQWSSVLHFSQGHWWHRVCSYALRKLQWFDGCHLSNGLCNVPPGHCHFCARIARLKQEQMWTLSGPGVAFVAKLSRDFKALSPKVCDLCCTCYFLLPVGSSCSLRAPPKPSGWRLRRRGRQVKTGEERKCEGCGSEGLSNWNMFKHV